MLYGFGVVHDAACNSEAKVDSVLKNKAWVWKPARSEDSHHTERVVFS